MARVSVARHNTRTVWLRGLAVLAAAMLAGSNSVIAETSHGIAMHGAPAMAAGFDHVPYVNPDAPKGGRLVQGLSGTFDSLNPFIVRGLAVQQVRGFVIESLMARGNDEPFCFGDVPGWADLHLVPQMSAARRLGCDLSAYPRLLAVEQRCNRIDAFCRAKPEMQPDYPG